MVEIDPISASAWILRHSVWLLNRYQPHKGGNKIGHVVRARTVRRCVENGNSGSDVIKLNAIPSHLKPDGDDVEVREREMDSDARMQSVRIGTCKQTPGPM